MSDDDASEIDQLIDASSLGTAGARRLRRRADVRQQIRTWLTLHPSEPDQPRIIALHPRSYQDARKIGESFRPGQAVIANLSDLTDDDAKRLVDFMAGLAFGLSGRLERISAKVFLLTPRHLWRDAGSPAADRPEKTPETTPSAGVESDAATATPDGSSRTH